MIRTVGPTRDLLARAVAEVVAVGRARGVALGDDEVQRAMTVSALPAGRLRVDGARAGGGQAHGARRVERRGRPHGSRVGRCHAGPRGRLAALLPTELRARGELRF